jgi:RpiR family carbohydrate utilization transcriptional regulator
MARPAARPANEVAGSYTLERIRTVIGSLSASELRVARLILDRPYEFIEWSAAQLAEQSGTSGATAVRTCRRLGFSGLRDLRLTLARDLGWPTLGTRPGASTRHGPVIHELFEDAGRSISGMVTKETADAFKRAVDYLSGARQILVVAAGPTQVFAQDFAINARVIGKPVDFWPDAIMQTVLASQLNRKDVCLAVSSSGVNSLTIDAASTARSAGARVVAVTGFQRSHLADIATVTLVANTFDYSTKSQAAINSAGLLLMLRGLLIAMTDKDAAAGDPRGHAVLDAKQTMGRYVYRRPSAGTNGSSS